MSTAWSVVGLGFGDEGKGSVVDALVRRRGAGLVVRFNGGPQAAHNVVTPTGRHHTFAQFGAGAFVPGMLTYLAPTVLVNPLTLLAEAEHLRQVGVGDAPGRLSVDARCLVITPFHVAANRRREQQRGSARHGSTGHGLGETVADDLAGHRIRMGDLRRPALARRLLQEAQERLAGVGGSAGALPAATVEDTLAAWRWVAEHVHIVDTPPQRPPGDIVLEGAQGVLLDESWGFHPHTTWTDCTFGNADKVLAAMGWDGDVVRMGLIRALPTRHGAGPFPTHRPGVAPPPSEHNTTGPFQGPLRMGWPDLVLLRYAVQVAQPDVLGVTCADHARGTDPIPVTHRYAVLAEDRDLFADDGATIRLSPRPTLDHQQRLGQALRRVGTSSVDTPGDMLPAMMSSATGIPLALVSHGPRAGDKTWSSDTRWFRGG